MNDAPRSHPSLDPEPAKDGGACGPVLTPQQVEKRGLLWIMGAFLFCPCHLPITLWLLATLLGGTALGAALRDHPALAGAAITLAWVAGTWRGLHLLNSAHAYAVRAKTARPLAEASDRVGSPTC